jgi:hypothetical protein
VRDTGYEAMVHTQRRRAMVCMYSLFFRAEQGSDTHTHIHTHTHTHTYTHLAEFEHNPQPVVAPKGRIALLADVLVLRWYVCCCVCVCVLCVCMCVRVIKEKAVRDRDRV